jgi:hypothetical protein
MRERARELAKTLDDCSKSGAKEEVEVLYDNRWAPPAYGDYFVVVMLVRFLVLHGLNVRLTVPQGGLYRRDWSILSDDEITRFTREQRIIASRFLPDGVARFPEAAEPSDPKAQLSRPQLFSRQLIESGYPFYRLAGGTLVALVTTRGWRLPESFLLTKPQAPGSPIEPKPAPHIAWSIRSSQWETSRNSTDLQTVRDFRALRFMFPGSPIHVLADARGLEMANRAFSGAGLEWSDSLVGQPIAGFSGAIDSALSASFYFQRLGGGLHMVPLFTSVPFLMIHPHRGDFFFGHGRQLLPWSNRDQAWVTDRRNSPTLSLEATLHRGAAASRSK